MPTFYYKNKKKQIVPSDDDSENIIAAEMLLTIFEESRSLLPVEFIEKWSEVKLYSPKRNIKSANQLINLTISRVKNGQYLLAVGLFSMHCIVI